MPYMHVCSDLVCWFRPNARGIQLDVSLLFQLAEEEVIKNITHWTLFTYYNLSAVNNSTVTPPPLDPADMPRGPCWETTVGIVSSFGDLSRDNM